LEGYQQAERDEKVVELDTKLLTPNPYQPRIEFDEEGIDELAASIKEYGQLQPIVVCKRDDDQEGYIIVAGERRWRACRKEALPLKCVVRPAMDIRMLQIAALQENVIRDRLHPVEVALAMQRLVETTVVKDWEAFGDMPGFNKRSIRRYRSIMNLSGGAMRLAVKENYRDTIVLEKLGRLDNHIQDKALQKIVDDHLGQELAIKYIKQVAKEAKEPKISEPLSMKFNARGVPTITWTWKPKLAFKDAPHKQEKFLEELQTLIQGVENLLIQQYGGGEEDDENPNGDVENIN
jgi:ParB family chromosome partitioning protein